MILYDTNSSDFETSKILFDGVMHPLISITGKDEVRMNIFKLNKVGVGALLAIALASGFTATPVYAEDMAKGCEHQRWDGEHRHAFFEQHQKELHDNLVLTANQEPAWKVFVEKTKPSERQDGMRRGSDGDKLKTPERMDLMLSKMKEHEKRIEAHAQATKEFYKQLTPEQQAIFDESFTHHPPHQR